MEFFNYNTFVAASFFFLLNRKIWALLALSLHDVLFKKKIFFVRVNITNAYIYVIKALSLIEVTICIIH